MFAGQRHWKRTSKCRNWVSHVIQWYFTMPAIVRFDKLKPTTESSEPKIPDLVAWLRLLFLRFIRCQCICVFSFKVCILYSYYYISSLHMRYMLMHSFGCLLSPSRLALSARSVGCRVCTNANKFSPYMHAFKRLYQIELRQLLSFSFTVSVPSLLYAPRRRIDETIDFDRFILNVTNFAHKNKTVTTTTLSTAPTIY